MRWRRRRAFANSAELIKYLKSSDKGMGRNTHHTLPQSRWDKRSHNPLMELNARLHTVLWHGALHQNMIGSEVALQWTTWWQRDHLFEGFRKGKIVCGYMAPGTLADDWRRIKPTPDMTPEQKEAWDELFGLKTAPDIVIPVANKLFIHPSTPLDLVPSGKKSGWSWNR